MHAKFLCTTDPLGYILSDCQSASLMCSCFVRRPSSLCIRRRTQKNLLKIRQRLKRNGSRQSRPSPHDMHGICMQGHRRGGERKRSEKWPRLRRGETAIGFPASISSERSSDPNLCKKDVSPFPAYPRSGDTADGLSRCCPLGSGRQQA